MLNYLALQGTPIFPDNATYKIREGEYETYKTTKDIFDKSLHEYTITHAIEDKNVLRFHIDYFKKGLQNARNQVKLLLLSCRSYYR